MYNVYSIYVRYSTGIQALYIYQIFLYSPVIKYNDTTQ